MGAAKEAAHVMQPCELVNSIAAFLSPGSTAASTNVGLMVKTIACFLDNLDKLFQINPLKQAQGYGVRLPQDRAYATQGATPNQGMHFDVIVGGRMAIAEAVGRFEFGF